MAMAVVLFPVSEETLALRASALETLAGLGVTSVALLRDRTTAGLVLEGWAFDPDRAHEAASAALGAGEGEGVRTLRPLMQMAVANEPIQGGRR